MATAYGAASQFLARRFGGALSEREANPTVGTSAEELLGGDPERVQVIVVNLSANIVYLGFRSDTSSSKGIRLNANGGSLSMAVDDDGILTTRQLFALASGAGSQLYVLSMRRESLSIGEE